MASGRGGERECDRERRRGLGVRDRRGLDRGTCPRVRVCGAKASQSHTFKGVDFDDIDAVG